MDGNQYPLETDKSFRAFDRLSQELSSAYFSLAEHAAGLEAELARSRREKERQREAKEHLADRLAALLDSLPGGVVVHDSDGCVSVSNEIARNWFGVELQGRLWADLLVAGRMRLIDDGRELETPDGTRLTASQRYVAGRQETIILLTDITEARRLQAAIEHNRRLATMGEMAARLAHQIRTPLATALLYAKHLTDGQLDSSQRQGFGEELLARLRDLDRLTGDMLGFVRSAPERSGDVSVATLFEDVRQTLDGPLREGRCLRIFDPPVAGRVRGDRQALAGALCNLVENAWQVGGPEVLVELSARQLAADVVELFVDDNGPGVTAELYEQIFEPFFSARCGGTGLGLPLARSVAEAHQGTLRLESRPGAGARFIFCLPLWRPGAGAAQPLALAGDAG